jgi:hypothetical protein
VHSRPLLSTARLVAATAVVLALPTAASAADPVTSEGLTPRLTAVAQAASSSSATQARRAGLPASGAASLSRVGGRVLTEITIDGDLAVRARALRAAGADVLHTSTRSRTITASVAPSALERVGAVDGVRIAREVLRPILRDATARETPGARAAGECGIATSQADAALRAADARAQFGVDGTGVKVGILSDTYDLATDDGTSAADDVRTGDLPGPANACGRTSPVQVLDDSAVVDDPTLEPSDEGRAMAQLVHDLAPGAQLAFATAFTGQSHFADNILLLRNAGAQVITDDVGYFGEPFFQPGPIDQAITAVREDGASYYSAAGNGNYVDGQGRPIGSWETDALRPVPTDPVAPGVVPQGLPGAGADVTAYEDFNPGAATDTGFGISVPAGTEILIDLQWAQPWNAVTTDLDAYLHDGTGQILKTSNDRNVGVTGTGNPVITGRPAELLVWKNTAGTAKTVQLSVGRVARTGYGDAGTPRLRFQISTLAGANPTAIEYPTGTATDRVGPTIFGHSGGADTVSVAAVPPTTTTRPQSYSSRGPVTQLFGATPATGPTPTLPAPVTLAKPDIAATDCTSTTFFSASASNIFCGTSAAAPHAAAIDALARQTAPKATDDQIVGFVRASGRPVGTFGPTAVGSGLIDAVAAVSAAASSSGWTPPQPTPAPVQPAPAPAPAVPSAPAPTPSPTPVAPPAVPAVDRTAPRVRVLSMPRLRTTKRRAIFRFSTERGARLTCRLDRGRAKRCTSRYAVTVARGAHVLRVYATDAAGNRSKTVVRRWRVVRG